MFTIRIVLNLACPGHVQLTIILPSLYKHKKFANLSGNETFNRVRKHDNTGEEEASCIGHMISNTVIVQQVSCVYQCEHECMHKCA